MGLTYQQCKALGLEHLWPTESKPLPVPQAPPSKAPADGMNKLERSFWERLQASEGQHYREALTLRLAGRTRYTPDFVTMLLGLTDERCGLVVTCWEVKGFMRDDAAVKLKVAADLFPAFRMVLVTRVRRKWECRFVTHTGIKREVWMPDWLR